MPAKHNPDTTVAMKALVLYGLLLFSGRRYSLRELAGRLDCSKQTVLRLVEQIETTHALPVHVQSELTDGRCYFWAAKPHGAPNVTLAETWVFGRSGAGFPACPDWVGLPNAQARKPAPLSAPVNGYNSGIK